jgi:hypothetical protein
VGAYYGAVNSMSLPGAAYVFTRSGTTWSQQAKLTAADGQLGDDFGCSISLQGGVLLVGAARRMVGDHEGQGVAYVFTRSGANWSQRKRLVAVDGSALDRFGQSVALSDDTAVVGAYFDTVGTTDRRGSAYVYKLTDPDKPAISSVYPANGCPTAAVIISGHRFGTTQGLSTVTFGGTAAPVTCWTDTAVYCSVPAGLTPGQADVVVTTSHGASMARPFTVDAPVPLVPVISSITPAHALRSATVTIAGSAFGASQDASTVTFGGTAATVSNWSDTAITCMVPAGLTPGVVDVVVHATLSSNVAGFAVDAKPSLSKISPTRGKVGITVTIVGKHFGAARGAYKVLFGTKAATRYVFWSATKIKVRVPRITKGRKAVRVVTAVGRSNAKYFTRF